MSAPTPTIPEDIREAVAAIVRRHVRDNLPGTEDKTADAVLALLHERHLLHLPPAPPQPVTELQKLNVAYEVVRTINWSKAANSDPHLVSASAGVLRHMGDLISAAKARSE